MRTLEELALYDSWGEWTAHLETAEMVALLDAFCDPTNHDPGDEDRT